MMVQVVLHMLQGRNDNVISKYDLNHASPSLGILKREKRGYILLITVLYLISVFSSLQLRCISMS